MMGTCGVILGYDLLSKFELSVKLASERRTGGRDMETANLLLSLSCGGKPEKLRKRRRAAGDGVFECKTCGRRFPSFQALGGHRTSHKQRRLHGLGLAPLQGSTTSGHQCSICGQSFAMGQALGGHMRRHKPLQADETLPEKKAAAGVEKSKLDLNELPLNDDCTRESSRAVLLELFV